MSRRTDLTFVDEDAAITDIDRLRAGHAQAGAWTLAQTCWHLDQTMQARMKPGPHPANTPEQEARREMLQSIMATGQLPSGLIAPEHLTPPPDASAESVDACIATLRRLKDFPGPLAPHRLFGHLPDADAHKQNLIHVAHHLSHFVPTQPTSQPTER